MTRLAKLSAAARAVLFMLCCTAILIAVSAMPLARSGRNSILFLGAFSSAGAWLATYAFTRWEPCSLASVGARIGRHSAGRLVAGLIGGATILGSQWILMWACGRVHWEFSPKVSPTTWVIMVLSLILLSAREEIAFHGFALRRLHAIIGLWAAQLCVAALFALEHMAGGTSVVNAVLGAGMGSLLFGLAAIATRGLAIPIGIHAAWNIGDWMRGGKATPGIWRPVVEPGYETYVQATGLGTYLLVVGLATHFIWYLYRTKSSILSA